MNALLKTSITAGWILLMLSGSSNAFCEGKPVSSGTGMRADAQQELSRSKLLPPAMTANSVMPENKVPGRCCEHRPETYASS